MEPNNPKKDDEARRREKEAEREIGEQLDALMNGLTPLSAVAPMSPDAIGIPKRRTDTYADFKLMDDDAREQAQKIVMSIAVTHFTDTELARPNIAVQIDSDVDVLADLLYQQKSAKHTLTKYREEVDNGNLAKDLGMSIHFLEKTMGEWIKTTTNFKNNLYTLYQKLAIDMRAAQEVKTTKRKLIDGGDELQVYGTKALLKGIKRGGAGSVDSDD